MIRHRRRGSIRPTFTFATTTIITITTTTILRCQRRQYFLSQGVRPPRVVIMRLLKDLCHYSLRRPRRPRPRDTRRHTPHAPPRPWRNLRHRFHRLRHRPPVLLLPLLLLLRNHRRISARPRCRRRARCPARHDVGRDRGRRGRRHDGGGEGRRTRRGRGRRRR